MTAQHQTKPLPYKIESGCSGNTRPSEAKNNPEKYQKIAIPEKQKSGTYSYNDSKNNKVVIKNSKAMYRCDSQHEDIDFDTSYEHSNASSKQTESSDWVETMDEIEWEYMDKLLGFPNQISHFDIITSETTFHKYFNNLLW